MMRKAVILLLVIALVFTTAIAGCTTTGQIQTEEEAQETLKDVSIDIGELENTLEEIENTLG